MSSDQPVHLSDEEKRAYRSLGSGPPSPASLEQRVVRSLRRERLVRAAPWRRTVPWVLAVLAGAALYLAGRASAPPVPEAAPTPRFVLFLQEPVGEAVPAEEEAARVEEYSSWARAQAGSGSLLAGEKLKDEERVLSAPGAHEGPTRATGYFVVAAPDLEGAVAVARTCPHLRHGGGIVVRPIDEVR